MNQSSANMDKGEKIVKKLKLINYDRGENSKVIDN